MIALIIICLCLSLFGCSDTDSGSVPIAETSSEEISSDESGTAVLPEKAVLYVLIAASDTCHNSRLRQTYAADRDGNLKAADRAAQFAEFATQQKNGGLYSNVVIRTFINGGFTKAGFLHTFDEFKTEMQPHDVLVLYFSAYSEINKKGDFFIVPWDGKNNSKRRNISFTELAKKITALPSRYETEASHYEDGALQKSLILADTNRGDLNDKIPAALSRIAAHPVEIPVLIMQNNSAAALIEQFEAAGERYVSVSHILPAVKKDFLIIDRWLNPAVLRISSLFPGTFTVTGAAGRQEQRTLDSLESAGLELPEGKYTVSIVYRNSHRESRTVELVNNSSANISFTYRPSLGAHSFSGPLPSFGVNVAELNPSGYRNIDQNTLTAMGMEQYRISFLAGEKLYQSGDYDRAITEYNRSISLRANYTDAYIARGSAYRRKGNYSRAIDDYTRAIEYGGSRAEVYNYRGYAHSERGDTEKAIADFSQALRLRRDYVDAYVNRAHAYSNTGDHNRAIDDYSQVLRLEPRNASAWNRRGSAWHRIGEDQKALADFSQAIAIRPDYALAWHNRGNVYFNTGDYRKALTDLNQVIRLSPSSAAYASRGNILSRLGETERAEADFAAAGR